jgi:hypothetical protein
MVMLDLGAPLAVCSSIGRGAGRKVKSKVKSVAPLQQPADHSEWL